MWDVAYCEDLFRKFMDVKYASLLSDPFPMMLFFLQDDLQG